MQDLLDKISTVAARAQGLEQQLADPQIAGNPAEYGKLAKELAALRPAAEAATAYRKVLEEMEGAQAMLEESDAELDESEAEEVDSDVEDVSDCDEVLDGE